MALILPIGSPDLGAELILAYDTSTDVGRLVMKQYYGSHDGWVVRLVTWVASSDKSGVRAIADVKEEKISAVDPGNNDSFVIALHNVIKELFRVGNSLILSSLVPSDLLNDQVFSAMHLKKAKTIQDYELALRTKSRLGWLYNRLTPKA